MFSPVWAPKAAVAVTIMGVGLPLLLLERSKVGFLATAFLGVATASAALSDKPAMSVVGMWGWGTGLLLYAAAVGAWALGRSLSEADKRLLERTLAAACCAVAVIAILQLLVNMSAIGLPLVFDRPTAMQGSPVYLSGLLAVLVMLTGYRLRANFWSSVLMLTLAGVALAVTQGRLALVASAIAPLLLFRRDGWRAAATTGAALILGLTIGVGVLAVDAKSVPSSEGAMPGLQAATGKYTEREGIGPRLATWGLAPGALRDRPLLGAGPGRFWAATVGRRSAYLNKYSQNTHYSDAHNFVIEVAVTTGGVGVSLMVGWLALAMRRARGPLAWAAAVLALLHLFQPLSVGLTPLALLLLGAAGSRSGKRRTSRPLKAVVGVFGAGSGVLAALFVSGTYLMRQSYLDGSAEQASRADRLLAAWPEPATHLALMSAGQVIEDGSGEWWRVRRHFVEATRRDPADPRVWARLGDFEQGRRRVDAAEDAYQKALRLDPRSSKALIGLAHVAEFRGDLEDARRWRDRLAR